MENSRLYPNCDFAIWFRSVNENNTTEKPIEGRKTGKKIIYFFYLTHIHLFPKGIIPNWINGSLYQNGPGLLDVTGKRVQHIFDAFSLIQKY